MDVHGLPTIQVSPETHGDQLLAAYLRGRHDTLEEIARLLFPPDGLDVGAEPAFEAVLVESDPKTGDLPAEDATCALNAITELVRQERRK